MGVLVLAAGVVVAVVMVAVLSVVMLVAVVALTVVDVSGGAFLGGCCGHRWFLLVVLKPF